MFGLLFGWLTRQVLKFIKRGGHKAPEQLALSLAMAYLVFYTSQVGKRPYLVLSLSQWLLLVQASWLNLRPHHD